MGGRRWLECEDAKLLAVQGQGIRSDRIRELSSVLGRSEDAVSQRFSDLGSPFHGHTHGETNGSLCRDFFDSWSNDSAYMAGFFCADGYFVHDGRGIAWSLHPRDRDLLERFKSVLGSGVPVREYPSYRRGSSAIARLEIFSKELVSGLSDMGVQTIKKTERLTWPDVPDRFLSDFVRGFFDGDGHVSFRRHGGSGRMVAAVEFTGNANFLEGMRLALCRILSIKINPARQRTRKRVFRLRLGGPKALRFGQWLYDLPCFLFLRRKRETWDRIFTHQFLLPQES